MGSLHFLFLLCVYVFVFSFAAYSSKPVVTSQAQSSTQVLLIIWKDLEKKVIIHLDSIHDLKKSLGLYAYSVI